MSRPAYSSLWRAALRSSRALIPHPTHRILPSTTRPKSTIIQAITNPPPPLTADKPRLQAAIRFLLTLTGITVGGHVFVEHFYTIGDTSGISMLPTMASHGDWILISQYYRRGRGVEVGDLVSYKHPLKPESRGVKRIIGMPGDYVLEHTPGTSGKMIQVPKGHCWIVGDNLAWSRDSRMFGPLPLALVKGKVIARIWPSPSFYESPLQSSVQDELDE